MGRWSRQELEDSFEHYQQMALKAGTSGDWRCWADLFTEDGHVVVAFHGYARAVHQLLHGRPDADRFHVRGFAEQGTTTTPFDMVVLNKMSRYHLVLEALRRARRVPERSEELAEHCRGQLARHHEYVREHFEDLPEIRDWTWA